ncbi:unnamed protein product, partial [Brachionus calyciflorus]
CILISGRRIFGNEILSTNVPNTATENAIVLNDESTVLPVSPDNTGQTFGETAQSTSAFEETALLTENNNDSTNTVIEEQSQTVVINDEQTTKEEQNSEILSTNVPNTAPDEHDTPSTLSDFPTTLSTSTSTTTTRFRGNCPIGYFISDDEKACIFDFERLSRNANFKFVTNLMDRLALTSEILAKCSLNCPFNTNCTPLNGTAQWYAGTKGLIHSTNLVYNLANREFYSFLGESYWTPFFGDTLSCKIVLEFNSTNPSFEIKSSAYPLQLDCSIVNLTAQETAASKNKNYVLFFNEAETKISRLKCFTSIPIGCKNTSVANCQLQFSLNYKNISSISKDRVVIGECSENSYNKFSCNPNDKSIKPMLEWSLADGEIIWDISVSLESKNLNHKNETYELELLSTKDSSLLRPLFANLILPTIQINFKYYDRPFSNFATCYNDPHCRTFDNKWFEFHQAGEYQLYENNETQTRIHLTTQRCSSYEGTGDWIAPYCLNKIFIQYFYELLRVDINTRIVTYTNLRTLTTNQVISFDSTGSPINTIESIILKKDGYGYEIVTGYGLTLKIYGYISNDELFLNRFDIIPSKLDFDKTGGMFSKWNNDNSDDLIFLKNGSSSNNLTQYFNSFKAETNGIPSLENRLYSVNVTNIRNKNSFCASLKINRLSESTLAKCFNGRNEDGFVQTLSRSKRSLINSIEIEKISNSRAFKSLLKNSQSTILTRHVRGVSDDSKKKSFCDSLADKAGDFGEKTGINSTIENCKLDVVADQFTDYTAGYENDVATLVVQLATNDVNEMTVNPDGSLAVKIDLSAFCPKNCSSHGTCSSSTATCTCDTNYSGADCSLYSLAVPRIISSTQTEIHDLSKGNLKDIIFSTRKYVISNPNSTFRFKVFYPDSRTELVRGNITHGEISFNLIYVDFTTISANLTSLDKWYFFVRFDASNDKSQYSNEVNITAADLTKYSCNDFTCYRKNVATFNVAPSNKDKSFIKFFICLWVLSFNLLKYQ